VTSGTNDRLNVYMTDTLNNPMGGCEVTGITPLV
jgi:hypothetical protein